MKFVPFFRAAALCTAVAMLPVATAGFAEVEGRSSPEFAKFFTAFQMIKANYVEPVSDKKLINGAINGMVEALDPHSAYLYGPSLERLNTMIDGKYQGLGISVQMDNGALKVISPFKGSPAAKAGIKAGDYITRINDKSIYGLKLDQAVQQMRGPAGSSIHLTIYRPGRDKPLELDVKRGTIELQPVTFKLLDGNVGHISVNEFSHNVGKDVDRAIKQLRQQSNGKLAGLILDLRQNPGGALDEAVALSDLFLTHGEIVSQRGRNPEDTVVYNAESVYPGDVTHGMPLIVLIDEGTASASEIVAGALQDHHRALIMGERSFGKGSVQTLLPLTQDSALKLTTALYFTPSGRSVQAGGIVPDIKVPQLSDPDEAEREKNALRESDLRGHFVNEMKSTDRALEKDRLPDPRFDVTAAQLKKEGITDFQLHYALTTMERAIKGGSTVTGNHANS